ncbi:DUF3109 family protein [Bacteroidota bacterium]
MIQIGKTIISLDIIEKHFICDLVKCKGQCCVYGDSGAPLEKVESEILDDIYEIIEEYLDDGGIETIKRQGKHIIDMDGDNVTPLVNNKECAYCVIEDGITKCAIEKAYYDGKTEFIKPISCHLFPVRITEYKKFDAINYKPIGHCICAKDLGKKNKTRVFEFLKEPLIRKYGEKWFDELEIIAKGLLIKGEIV